VAELVGVDVRLARRVGRSGVRHSGQLRRRQ
jgi:hypothetical protein